MAGPWGAIIGGVLGGVLGGVTAGISTHQREVAYHEAAKELKEAAKKYSGDTAYNTMLNEGYNTAKGAASSPAVASNPMGGLTAGADSQVQNTMASAYNTGTSNAAQKMDAAYNAVKDAQEMKMKQADINAGVTTQAGQTVANTASGLAQLYGQTKGGANAGGSGASGTSDENCKDIGLKEADIEDSLRQLKTVLYKYKEDTGLDQDTHVGVTAQDLEKTPLFQDTVQQGITPSGQSAKQIDEWKLLETLTAAEAQLQKEIDDLKNENSDLKKKE